MHSTTFFLTNLSRKRRRNKAKQGIDSHTIHLSLEFIILIPVYVTCNNAILLFPSVNSGWKTLPILMTLVHIYLRRANFTTSLVLKMKSCQVLHKWIPKVEQLERMPKECKCKEFWWRNLLVWCNHACIRAISGFIYCLVWRNSIP